MNNVSPMQNKKTIHMPNQSQAKGVSGAGMDRQVTENKWPIKKGIIGIAIIVIIGLFLFSYNRSLSQRSLSIDNSRIQVSQVSQGVFEDVIPTRAIVVPAKTVYLDAIEGGRVERILVEDGAKMQAGGLIVELSNATLQLNVLGNEAQVAEQLNNMRTIELSLEQNRLQHKRNLVDIEYQIQMFSRQLERESGLLKQGAVVQSQYDDTRDTLNWYKKRLELTLESQASDNTMQQSQLAFLQQTTSRLEHNLNISKQNLDSMNVRAPVDGTLSGFDVEVGQSIARGERLGQIDTPNNYKLTANIDEFYLDRVMLGQLATYENYTLQISKIYPQVKNGQFEIDLRFIEKQPSNIRRGQTIQTRLTLGDATEAVLIPNGTFYQDTGGKWIFVINSQGTEAVRRPISLGRRNSRFIEVIDGLEVGEQVIVGPYSGYQDLDKLNLN